MGAGIRFDAFRPEHRTRCLELFDANCPEHFAPNERAEYAAFLDAAPDGYEVCMVDGEVAGAFGLISGDAVSGDEAQPGDAGQSGLRLNWILLDPAVQGRGVGTAIMERVAESAGPGAVVDIAASHRSAPFFARFGAVEVRRTEDGWGPGMHRVDMRFAIN